MILININDACYLKIRLSECTYKMASYISTRQPENFIFLHCLNKSYHKKDERKHKK